MSCNKSCKDTIILGGNQKNVPAPFCIRCASGRGMRVGRYGAFGPFRSGEGDCGRKRKRGNRDRRQGGQCRCAGGLGPRRRCGGNGDAGGGFASFSAGMCRGERCGRLSCGCNRRCAGCRRSAGGAVRSGLGRGGRHNPARRRSVRIGTVRPGLQANEQAGAARRVQVCAAACVPLTGNRSLRNRRRGSGRTGTGSHSPL